MDQYRSLSQNNPQGLGNSVHFIHTTSRSQFSKLSLNEFDHFLRFLLRREKLDYFTFRVDHKFSEIPRNYFRSLGIWIKKLTVVSKINKERMSFFSIHFNLFKNWEFNIEVLGDKFFNLFRRSTFLTKELIARESKDFEPILAPSFMSLNHLFVVIRSQSSFACYIYNHD